MILVEREDTLPAAVQLVKKEVLLCLQAVHALHEYDTITGLTGYLDENLAAAGLTGLTRVVLFYRDPRVRLAIEQRMAKDGVLNMFRQPACWLAFKSQLPELRKRADQFEPGWVALEMAKG